MKPKTKNRINTAITVVALIVAVILLSHRLRAIRPEELMNHLKTLKGSLIFLIFISTGISYCILTGFDWVALRFLRKPISYAQISRAAFVGYSLSKKLGISWLTGESLRYRFYSRRGMGMKRLQTLARHLHSGGGTRGSLLPGGFRQKLVGWIGSWVKNLL